MDIFGLYDYQAEAVSKMKNGCILCGGVGSGKSRTGLAYFLFQNRVSLDSNGIIPPKETIQDLYIITTARKRDTKEWESDMIPFLLSSDPKLNIFKNTVIVDSWNNIAKYVSANNSFFIFDEQRLVGSGKWVKSFYKIARNNDWILLSATPGDTWSDYIPVFVANGFYRNKTEFESEHAIKTYYAGYPKIDRWIGEKHLEKLKQSILIPMNYQKHTTRHYIDVMCKYDRDLYLSVVRKRWNPYTQEPIAEAAEYCQCLRKVVNTNISRLSEVFSITVANPKCIIFYYFDYELELLKGIKYLNKTTIGEWNGHKHDAIPETERWVYLVQYTAGCEGWNCTETNTIIFYSQQYSYKVFEQASGRIDRVTTPFNDLYYYVLKSTAPIDKGIALALSKKRDFNYKNFTKNNFNGG